MTGPRMSKSETMAMPIVGVAGELRFSR